MSDEITSEFKLNADNLKKAFLKANESMEKCAIEQMRRALMTPEQREEEDFQRFQTRIKEI